MVEPDPELAPLLAREHAKARKYLRTMLQDWPAPRAPSAPELDEFRRRHEQVVEAIAERRRVRGERLREV
jgi:hypothetical protein